MSRPYRKLTLYHSQWSLSTRKEKDYQWWRHLMGYAISRFRELHRSIEDLSWEIPWSKSRIGNRRCHMPTCMIFDRLQRLREPQQLVKRRKRAKIHSHSSSNSKFNSNKCTEISNSKWLVITMETCKIKIHHEREREIKVHLLNQLRIYLADLCFVSCPHYVLFSRAFNFIFIVAISFAVAV